jgi:hypothetical protein
MDMIRRICKLCNSPSIIIEDDDLCSACWIEYFYNLNYEAAYKAAMEINKEFLNE